jgi:hypothetical protein
MDKVLLVHLAEAAGLAETLAAFPEDVADAVLQAEGFRRDMTAPADPAAEPWPPMRPRPAA